MKNPAAVALGRKGGSANTKAQNEARARNGKLGGRPAKQNIEKRWAMVRENAGKNFPGWKRRVVGGWITADGLWSVRGPIMAAPMFWVYTNNNRFSPTGKYDDCVSFKTCALAKRFVEGRYESGEFDVLARLRKKENAGKKGKK